MGMVAFLPIRTSRRRVLLYTTRGELPQARSASDGTVPSLALRVCGRPFRVEYIMADPANRAQPAEKKES